MEDEYDYDAMKEVGKVSYEALQHARSVVKPGVKLLDAARVIEAFIMERGFGMAFPVNLSLNSQAAHYTPAIDDTAVFTDNDVVKVDLGARKGAYLGDCAMTIDLTGGQAKLIEASEEALEEAISMVKAGRKVCEIGAAVEKVAGAKGFRPIRNLGGHGVSREDLHARIFIPNYDNGDETALEEGEVIAIEPFMTDGEGRVKDGASLQIYQKVGSPAARLASTRVIADFIDAKYSTYPFALRWLFRDIGGQTEFTVLRAIADLSAADALDRFPVLVERRGGMVAQAEKEMIVEKDGCSVITA